MKHFLTLSLCFLALSLSAQETITYPYNPDGDADGLVAVPDIQDLLAVYGSPFSPAEIMVGDTALSEWIQILYQALQDQQAVIEAMQGAGGCDVRFPDGLDGEYFTTLLRDADMNDYPYSVPSGKTLYVTNVYAGGTTGKLLISNNNGGASAILAGSNNGNSDYGHSTLHNPIIVNEGQTLSGYGNPGLSVSIHGFLVDYGVVPITWNEGGYQVPANKRLYVFNVRGDLYVDDILISYASGQRYVIGHPIVINSSQVVSVVGSGSVNDGGTVNGYLVDENYFADCGGGGSSEVGENTFIYDMQPEIDGFWQLYTYTGSPPYFPVITIPSGYDKVVLTGSDSNYCNTNNCERVNVEISGGDMYDEITIIWETNNLRLMNFGVYQSGAINKGHIRVIKMMDGWTGEFRIQ